MICFYSFIYLFFLPLSFILFFFFRGKVRRGLELFQKAIDVAHTETELAHLYSLYLAAKAQSKAIEHFGGGMM